MDRTQIIFALIGFSSSFILCLTSLAKWRRRKMVMEKLSIIEEALVHAEERVLRFQERHDRIVDQLCSYYFSNKELEVALAGARAAMNDALEFAVGLRKLQMSIISSYPDEIYGVLSLNRPYGSAGRSRNV